MVSCKKWVLFVLLPVVLSSVSEPVHAGNKVNQAHTEKAKGGKITFSGHINETWQIWSVNPDGSGLSQVTHCEDVHSPSWSPDGKKLAYTNNEGKIYIHERGKKPQKMRTPSQKCAHPCWSPEGDRIAFVCFSFKTGREDSDIWVAEIKDKNVYKFIETPNIQKDPGWSPDGNSIVYTTGYWDTSGQLIEEVWVVDIINKSKKQLIANNTCNIQPSWSPDGEWIAFASDRTGNMEIWVVKKDGKKAKQLTRHQAYDADPCWSPDGSKICFVSTRGGKMDIWGMDKAGRNVRQITNVSKGDCKDPYWH